MKIYIERFLLGACLILFGVVVTNPLKMDNTQRVTGGLAVVFAAYFLAHTLQRDDKEPAALTTTAFEEAKSPQPQAPKPPVSSSLPIAVPKSTAQHSSAEARIANRVQTPINGAVYQTGAGLDGKIYITGSFTAVGEEIHVGLARLNSDGSVDSSFKPELAGGGFAFCFFPDGSFLINTQSSAVRNYSRHGILNSSYPAISGPRTLILNEDGSFYTSTGRYLSDGTSGIRFAEQFETLAMAIQPDGRLILGGTGGRLIRLNTNGTLDITFTAPEGIHGGNVHGIGVQHDGKIVVSGGSFALLPIVFRLNQDGTLDRTFKSASPTYGPVHCLPDGTILISSGSNGTSITFDSAGRIITGGSIVRLNPDGSLHETQPTPDPAFGDVAGISVYLPFSRDTDRSNTGTGAAMNSNNPVHISGNTAPVQVALNSPGATQIINQRRGFKREVGWTGGQQGNSFIYQLRLEQTDGIWDSGERMVIQVQFNAPYKSFRFLSGWPETVMFTDKYSSQDAPADAPRGYLEFSTRTAPLPGAIIIEVISDREIRPASVGTNPPGTK